MPVEVAVWKLGSGTEKRVQELKPSLLLNESELEDLLCRDLSIVDPGWLLIGRQVRTSSGKYIDLLALDQEGRVIVLELKRDQTPREAVAQLLDYGSWVVDLEAAELDRIYAAYQQKHAAEAAETLPEAFLRHFGTEDAPTETFNGEHQLVLVASRLDESSERIVNYLAETHGVSINAIFFRTFEDEGKQYLTRAWLADPEVVEEKVVRKTKRLAWNGEHYVNFQEHESRSWDEAREHGFIAASGGAWYTQTLDMLGAGDRIWVNIPGSGYVGVGEVLEPAAPAETFTVSTAAGEVPIGKSELKSGRVPTTAEDEDKAGRFVRVKWLASVPAEAAFKEKGLFGIQHTVCRPRNRKWELTVERLKDFFKVDGGG